MERSLTILFSLIFIFSATADGKQTAGAHRKKAGHAKTSAKAKAPYCAGVKTITDCHDEGCGPKSDPELNKLKNIRSDPQQPVTQTIAWMKSLPDPENFTEQNKEDRTELKQIGEGQKITVPAWVLDVRREGQETCNCGLTAIADTDNHLVLVEPTAKKPTLKRYEPHSITAEFTPRVRLDHPKFTRERLAPLIDPKWKGGTQKPVGKLLVRVTGLLMFDSHHFLNNALNRENNWEIHPILKFEYCPPGLVCKAESDANWKDLENE
jgi:hypothetical protein